MILTLAAILVLLSLAAFLWATDMRSAYLLGYGSGVVAVWLWRRRLV